MEEDEKKKNSSSGGWRSVTTAIRGKKNKSAQTPLSSHPHNDVPL
jgi:hypothetical protein